MGSFKIPKKSIVLEAKEYVLITLGLIIYAFGWVFFLLPFKLVSGGTAGIGAIIQYATGFPMQYTYFIINIILLCVAIKELGVKFCVKTIYAVFALTFCLELVQELLYSYKFDALSLLGQEATFEASIIGACFCGMGIGICFVNGGSTGGTDIIAAIINKYRDVSLGRVIMSIDVAVVVSSGFIFGSGEVSKVFYGLITLLISATMLDYVVNSNRRLVQFLIFSKKYDEISEYITKDMHRGVTLLNGVGYYTKEDTKVIVTMMRATEAVEVFRIVHEIDPCAFITQSRVSGVYGAGFDKIKVKK
ncbi:MAG: YitT family protein [Bacteroidales bacterium]|nr:YitT family protein [Bacteroidales bacterium]MBR2607413.1 YitT family protein [Bacteroidaceae bacterium]